MQARSTSLILNVESDIHSVKFNNDDNVQSALAASALLSSYEKKVKKIQAKLDVIDLKHTREKLSALQL